MIKELKYMSIDYSNKDFEYIDELSNFLEEKSIEAVNFFDISSSKKKVYVKLYDNLIDFRNDYKEITKNESVRDWVCGYSYDSTHINTLCMDEYRKTHSHENDTLRDLELMILHEFVHSCHLDVNKDMQVAWLCEGFATSVSHQFDGCKKRFNVSLDEMINGTNDYVAYYTMYNYVYDKYGKEYLLELLKNEKMLEMETPRLYEEVKKSFK